MLFELFFYFSQARKEICICNNDCTSLCPAVYFNASSNTSFQDFIIPHIKDEREIYLYLYSRYIEFSFSMDLSYFRDHKLTIKALNDSKEILLYIKEELKENYTETKVKPGYKIILPDLIPIPDYNNNKIKKYISSSNSPNSTTIPISLGLHQLKHQGEASCENGPNDDSGKQNYRLVDLSSSTDNNCRCPATEDDLDTPSAYLCGYRCYGAAIYEYTFKGVQFAIYGTKDNSRASCYVKVDDNPEEYVNLSFFDESKKNRLEYTIIYTSDILKYDYHKVKISPDPNSLVDGNRYEINKFVYWPSLTAKRLNCTDFILNPDGDADDEKWRTETDGIGGIRKIRNQNGAAIVKLQCTKFWIYGIVDNGQGDLNVYYNGKSDSNTTNSPDGKRRENALIYESPEFDYSSITVNLKPSSGNLIIYCIFYEVPPTPTQTPIPISVGLLDVECEQSDKCATNPQGSESDYNKEYSEDFGCSKDNLNSPGAYQCGIRCWGSQMTISYTFKGVKFGIFGNYDTNYGSFDVNLDGKNIANVNANAPTLTYSILFESDVYVYKEHTVSISSNGLYEIYKLVFWPTTKANRYNSSASVFSYSDLTKTESSDAIGGAYYWFEHNAYEKYYKKSFYCSKFWIYHHTHKYYGNVTISYDNNIYSASQETNDRVRYKLIFDSDEFAYKNIDLKVTSKGYLTLCCVYYHTQPSEFEYIDKNFYITLPYIQIFVAPNSIINQISGCNFSHISEVLDYFIILQKDISFFDNIFEYSNSDEEAYAMPINIQYNSQASSFLTIRNCTFIQATRKARNSGANVFYCSQEYTINVNFQSCLFENCGLSSSEIIIQIENQNSFIQMDNCTFQFTQNSCKAIEVACSKATINDCKFIKSGPIIIEQKEENPSSTASSNNIAITGCTFDSCSIPNYDYKAIQMIFKTTSSITFEYNVISNIKTTESNDYSIFIDGNNKIEQFELKNITFINNSCSCLYGGGVGMVVHNINILLFTCCDFINNEARQNLETSRNRDLTIPGDDNYYNGDGGAIQIGFYCSTNKAALTFEYCTFTKNKAKRHGGALAIQTLSTVEINHCLFELNEANYEFTSAAELLFENHFNKKKQGRGGAIYINPSYTYNEQDNPNCQNTDDYLKKISIKNCQFLTNSAFDGFAVYIEGDEVNTDFVIETNVFDKNYNYDENSANSDPNLTVRGVIATEIHTISDVILDQNTFIITNSKKLIFVDHYGSILSSIAFTLSGIFSVSSDFSNSQMFTTSQMFSNSDKFSKSSYFSHSEKFTETSYFSKTEKFTRTSIFSYSEAFTNTAKFSSTELFTRTSIFSYSKSFTGTEKFTHSNEFSESKQFSNSFYFSQSQDFSPSAPLLYDAKCALYINDEYILINNCDYSQFDSNTVSIKVITTNFTGYQKYGDGSAIHLINCGFFVNQTCFIDCESTSPVGGGGAIFINNSMNIEKNISFIDILFLRCRAAYGGAVFLCSNSDLSYNYFLRCQFLNNEAYAKKSVRNENKNLFGGSAIYASTKSILIENTTFNKNKASGVKIHNLFDKEKSKYLLENAVNPFSIIGCNFEKDEKSKSAISYIEENSGNKLEIMNCNFKGKLRKDHHYIDGVLQEKESVHVESCKFEFDENNVINLELLSDSSSLNLNPSLQNFWKFILGIAIFITLFSLIALKLSIYRNLECSDEKVLEP